MNPNLFVDPTSITFDEWLLVITLVSLFAFELIQARLSGSWIQMFRPTLMVAAILSYYCVVAPLRTIAIGETFERGQELRGAIIWGLWGAVAFYGCLLIGYHQIKTPRFDRRFLVDNNVALLYKLGRVLCWIGVVMYALVAGPTFLAQINPLTAAQNMGNAGAGFVGVIGALSNYFVYGLNLLIPGVLLLFATWTQDRTKARELIGWFMASAGLFTTLGFRWRLIMLVVPIVLLWYLRRRRAPNLLGLAALGLALIIVVSGAIGQGRNYGYGINTSAQEGKTFEERFDDGIIEGRTVFLTTSGLIDRINKPSQFVGTEPLVSLVLIVIPRQFLPDKDTIGYLKRSLLTLYTDPAFAAGAATLNYGEYYLMFGWSSLIAMSLVLGWGLRCLWNWFLLRWDEPLAQVTYVLSACFLYVVISRGYMAQVAYLGAFTLLPLYWLYRHLSKPVGPPSRRLVAVPPQPLGQ